MAFCPTCGKEVAQGAKFCGSCGAVIGPATPPGGAPVMPAPATQSGLQKNVASLLCYLLGWVTGIIFLVIEKDRDIRFHAFQSIFVFGALQIAQFILNRLFGAIFFTSLAMLGLWGLINTVIWIGQLVLWILLMVKANQGVRFKVPIAGELAEKYAG